MNRNIIAALAGILVMVGYSTDAEAVEYHTVVHGLSKHATTHDSGTGAPWREVNPGLGLRLALSDEVAAQVGFYKNSQDHTSVYALADYLPFEISGVRLGGALGIVTGYRAAAVMPAASFVVRWQTATRVSITLRLVPPKVPKVTTLAAIELGIRF